MQTQASPLLPRQGPGNPRDRPQKPIEFVSVGMWQLRRCILLCVRYQLCHCCCPGLGPTAACCHCAGAAEPDARLSPDQNQPDQEQQTPFGEQQGFHETFKTAAGSLAGSEDGDDDDEDAVPDVSPLACSTLRQHLSVQPETFDMEWQEMGCSYNIQGTTKVVLQGIWGRAHPGEMQVRGAAAAAGAELAVMNKCPQQHSLSGMDSAEAMSTRQ